MNEVRRCCASNCGAHKWRYSLGICRPASLAWSIEQQAILSVHRVRQGFVKARTAQANQIRGLLGEFGLVIPQGIYNVAKRVPELLEDASNELPVPFRHWVWFHAKAPAAASRRCSG